MTNDLAALSEAATQGEWTTESEYGDEWYFGNTDDCMETVVRVGWNALMVAGRANNPDLLLAVALVNEYRAGRLVPVDQRDKAEALLCQRTNEYIEATARAEAAEAENARLKQALRYIAAEANSAVSSDGMEFDKHAFKRIVTAVCQAFAALGGGHE